MKIVVSSNGKDLNAPASPIFGRCPVYLFVDTETMQFEAVDNPAIGAPGGAGIQAAQFVIERGAQAVITGNTGPNAFNVFNAAGTPLYLFQNGTVLQAVEAFKAGQLTQTGGATAAAHAGMGGGMGMGGGRGMGMGSGRGMGMGGGRGMGMGGGRGMGMGMQASNVPPVSAGSATNADRDAQITNLQETLGELRQQMAAVMEQLNRLEGKG